MMLSVVILSSLSLFLDQTDEKRGGGERTNKEPLRDDFDVTRNGTGKVGLLVVPVEGIHFEPGNTNSFGRFSARKAR